MDPDEITWPGPTMAAASYRALFAVLVDALFAATRERYLATSTRSRRVVAPKGSGHNFVYENPEWTIGVMREVICSASTATHET